MRARWVLNDPSPELPLVGRAIVASWWPTVYHAVSTVQLDSASALARLTRSLVTGEYSSGPLPDRFVTQVFRCDRQGWIKSFDHPLYEMEYADLLKAKPGHKEVVDLLGQGKLRLSPRR